ncbi:rrna-processing protein ebp2-like protein [Dermatophagoides farinae]|uniref:Rrna-processing protein ebp2-like protein n=2 Tax=Dermatophagoides farinae TaxID=6954 RepID=A0A9D4P3R6_DERFA|nr:rrna-processing protein ebp2-like protein [Dermatophagoides farinae]
MGKLKPGLYGMLPFKRTAEQINDKEGLMKKLNEIKIFDDNWLERLDLISEPAIITPELLQQYGDLDLKVNRKGEISGEELDDPAQNDFKREMLFYRQAQTTVMDSIRRFHNHYNIKNTRRPDDYFAEMLKSDEHMKKVHQKLETQQTTMEASDKAKRQRDLKKYGKKVQQEIQLKRQQEKRELLEKIQRYKKGKLDSLDFLDQPNGGPSTSKSKQQQQPKQQMNGRNVKKNGKAKITKKQRYKETRYGYGGQKKRSKYNSSQSAADMSTFSARKNGRPKIKANRPGKSRRQKIRNKSR